MASPVHLPGPADEAPFLRRGALEELANGPSHRIFGFRTLATLPEVLAPTFLGRQLDQALLPGDLLKFTAGPEEAPLHGLLMVVAITPREPNVSGEVTCEVVFRTGAQRTLKAVT